jgi:hypothetical protein
MDTANSVAAMAISASGWWAVGRGGSIQATADTSS